MPIERRLSELSARADVASAYARARVEAIARRAFQTLWERLLAEPDADVPALVMEVSEAFGTAYTAEVAQAFERLLQRAVLPSVVAAMPVGEVVLSQALYRHAQTAAAEVSAIVRTHAQGVHQARELMLELYDGYSPADGIRRPLEGAARADLPSALRMVTQEPRARAELGRLYQQAQAQASRVKSEALRASYLEALEAWKDGAGQQALRKRLDVAYREKTRFMAERIAQTELAKAYQAKAAQELMADPGEYAVQVRINPAHPREDVCDLHARADLFGLGPGIYPKAKAPRPPFHPHCLLGDALITAAGRITAVSKRWFDGDIVVITTASGKRLSATVNHPVLTPGGWVRAGLIDVGGDVIARVTSVPVGGHVLLDHDHENVPASIAEIADAFLASCEVSAREVPVAPEDFHGDGVASKVAVIGADRQLWDGIDAASAQIGNDAEFQRAGAAVSPLLGDGDLNFGGEGSRLPTHSIVSSSDHFGTAFSAHSLEADDVLGGLRSERDPSAQEPLGDSVAADAELARQIQDGATGPVFADKVINIERHAFSGHVYNLETESGHYTGNGIVTHNCWCRLRARQDIEPGPGRAVPGAAAAYLRSLDPAEAARVMGSAERAQQVMAGADPDAVLADGVAPAHRTRRLGDPVARDHHILRNSP